MTDGPTARPGAPSRARRPLRLGTAAVAVLVVLLVPTVSGGSVASGLRGAVPSLSGYVWSTGCATPKAPSPAWSGGTARATFGAHVAAHTCPAVQGGRIVASSAYSGSSVTLQLPLTLRTGSGGVNVTWNVTASSFSRAAITSYRCPVNYANSTTRYNTTWYNVTDVYQNCYALAWVQVYGYAWLTDVTANYSTIYGAFYWSLYNVSGATNYTATVIGNYSNASYWGYNYTLVYGPYDTGYGTSGNLTGNWAPTWFLNGTFVHSHRYVLTTYVGVYAYANAVGLRASTSAALNAASRGYGATVAVATW